jgi:hypothetical protein
MLMEAEGTVSQHVRFGYIFLLGGVASSCTVQLDMSSSIKCEIIPSHFSEVSFSAQLSIG